MNRELPDIKAGFRKGRGTKDKIANICWIIEKARALQKNIYFCFIDYAKAFDCVDHNKLWKILQEFVITDHLTCLLRYLYAGQEATIRTRHGRVVPSPTGLPSKRCPGLGFFSKADREIGVFRHEGPFHTSQNGCDPKVYKQ